jgi:hypothetical protein
VTSSRHVLVFLLRPCPHRQYGSVKLYRVMVGKVGAAVSRQSVGGGVVMLIVLAVLLPIIQLNTWVK